MFVSHLYVFFGEMLFSSLAHFLTGSFIFMKLSCRSCLYIFEISPLSVVSFAIIFSHSEGCLFTLLSVSFVVQKLLILIRSHLFILAFILSSSSPLLLTSCIYSGTCIIINEPKNIDALQFIKVHSLP